MCPRRLSRIRWARPLRLTGMRRLQGCRTSGARADGAGPGRLAVISGRRPPNVLEQPQEITAHDPKDVLVAESRGDEAAHDVRSAGDVLRPFRERVGDGNPVVLPHSR